MFDVLPKNPSPKRSRKLRGTVVELREDSLNRIELGHLRAESQTYLQNTRKLLGAQVPQNRLRMKTLGDQAKAFRGARGWTARQLAEEVGTSRQNIESLEASGNRIPKYLGKLAAVMGTTADDMLAEAGLAPRRPKPKTSAPPGGPLADRLRQEREADPYQLIERGLSALLIVSHAKDHIMEKVREAAEVAAETQKAVDEIRARANAAKAQGGRDG